MFNIEQACGINPQTGRCVYRGGKRDGRLVRGLCRLSRNDRCMITEEGRRLTSRQRRSMAMTSVEIPLDRVVDNLQMSTTPTPRPRSRSRRRRRRGRRRKKRKSKSRARRSKSRKQSKILAAGAAIAGILALVAASTRNRRNRQI